MLVVLRSYGVEFPHSCQRRGRAVLCQGLFRLTRELGVGVESPGDEERVSTARDGRAACIACHHLLCHCETICFRHEARCSSVTVCYWQHRPRAACSPPRTSDSRPRGSSPTLYSTAYTRALGVLSCDLRNVAIVHCRYCLCSSARGCAVALPRHKPAHFTTKRSGRVNPQSGGSAAATQPHECVPPPTVTGGGCGGSKSAGVCVRSALLAAFPLLQDGGAAARSALDRGTATPKDEAPRAERRERHAKGFTKGPYTPLPQPPHFCRLRVLVPTSSRGCGRGRRRAVKRRRTAPKPHL
mgnify:CR=1 FL=1